MTDVKQRDVVDVLLAQHEEIKDLFRRIPGAQGDEKRMLFQSLVRLLAVHESAEEQIVHPAARHAFNDGKDVVDSRLHEENEAKRALVSLDQMGVEHPEFDQKLNALSQAVTAHATHEEDEEFPQLRKSLPPDRLRQMAGAFEAAEAVAPTHPHPNVGESAAANLLAGPPTAIFDRVKDAMRDWQNSRGSRGR